MARNLKLFPDNPEDALTAPERELAARNLAWQRDVNVEKYLDHMQVGWEYLKNVPVDTIDWETSQRNKARPLLPLDWDQAARICRTFAVFAHFLPAIVCHRNAKKKLNVNDGNHRVLVAKILRLKTVDVYVIADATGEGVNEEITKTLNAMLVGRAPTKSEYMQNCVDLGLLPFNLDTNCNVLAARYVQPPSTYCRKLNAAKLKIRLSNPGNSAYVAGASELTEGALIAIGQLKSDVTQKQLAKEAISSGITIEGLRGIVDKIDKSEDKNEAAHAQIIADEIAAWLLSHPRRQGGGGKSQTPADKLLDLAKKFQDLLLDVIPGTVDVLDVYKLPPQRAEFGLIVTKLRTALTKIAKDLKPACAVQEK